MAHAYALLISVDEHSEAHAALPHLTRDAAALRAALEDPARAGYDPDHVRMLKGKSASREKIFTALGWLQDRMAVDRTGTASALVYFAGHGQIIEGRHALIPFDAKAANLRKSAILAEEFAEALTTMRAPRLFVVLDCCHSGGMGVKGRAPYPSEAIPSASVMPALADTACVVLSSSQPDQKSHLRRDGQLSIFMHHLVEALGGFVGDAKSGLIHASEVGNHVLTRVPASVAAEWNGEQTPDVVWQGDFPVSQIQLGNRMRAIVEKPAFAKPDRRRRR